MPETDKLYIVTVPQNPKSDPARIGHTLAQSRRPFVLKEVGR